MENRKSNRLFIIVGIIGLLMLVNIYLIKENGNRIERNQEVLSTTEKVIITSEEIIQTLHLIDVAVRGYAITSKIEMYQSPADSAENRKNLAFDYLQSTLKKQNYHLKDFNKLQDSVNFYFSFVKQIAKEIQSDNIQEARLMISEDRGYPVWLMAKRISDEIKTFEEEVASKAYQNFHQAIKTSLWLQILLFLIAMPTLIYAAIYSNKSIKLSDKLRKSEKEKATILENQNETLDRLVRKRTDEILAQNEEIRAQNEEISSQNDIIMSHNQEMSNQQKLIEEKNEELTAQNEILNNAKATIEKQQRLLELRNEELAEEVAKQNENLKETNLELVEQINKLEQFGYIVSHNLRAPIARLLGLGNLIGKTDTNERETIVNLMIKSSYELQNVIDDIGTVLLIQKPGSKTLEEVDLIRTFKKVENILNSEIEGTGAEIIKSFEEVNIRQSIPVYIESIFYNLIANALKYHQKYRRPIIKVSSYSIEGKIIIEIEDNGMGIDIEKHEEKLFGLYKRFHFHVEGKGMGLYLVKSQVEALGGKIKIQSQIGKGTKFSIYLDK
jgi:signal transduction histidine kinase